MFFGCFLLRLSRIKRSQVIFMGKFPQHSILVRIFFSIGQFFWDTPGMVFCCGHSWKIYPSPNIFYTSTICAICDKFQNPSLRQPVGKSSGSRLWGGAISLSDVFFWSNMAKWDQIVMLRLRLLFKNATNEVLDLHYSRLPCCDLLVLSWNTNPNT